MNNRQYLSVLLATIVSGLAGGAGFSWFFAGQPAAAQSSTQAVVSAQEFRLVDASGKLRAILSENPMVARGTPSLVLYDANQKARLAVGTFRTAGEPSIQLMDENEMGAIVATRFQGKTSLQLSNIMTEPLEGGGVGRSSIPAVWLTHSSKDGSNIEILDKEMKRLWSARK